MVKLTTWQLRKYNTTEAERCALMFLTSTKKIVLVEVPNRSKDKVGRFRVAASDVTPIVQSRISDKLIGIMHTHPTMPLCPSGHDIEGIAKTSTEYIGAVYCIPARTVVWYDKNGGYAIQLLRKKNNDVDLALER